MSDDVSFWDILKTLKNQNILKNILRPCSKKDIPGSKAGVLKTTTVS